MFSLTIIQVDPHDSMLGTRQYTCINVLHNSLVPRRATLNKHHLVTLVDFLDSGSQYLASQSDAKSYIICWNIVRYRRFVAV